MSPAPCRAAVHPIKSCAGIAAAARPCWSRPGWSSTAPGWWSTPHGEMLTQRDCRAGAGAAAASSQRTVLRAPGMLALHLRWTRWKRRPACACGTTWSRPTTWARWRRSGSATFWAAAAPGALRPRRKRLSDPAWAGDPSKPRTPSPTASRCWWRPASLDDLNAAWPPRAVAPVTMQRFRPNLVLTACRPFDEDHLDETRHRHRRRPGAAAPGQALRALQHPQRGPGHRDHRPRAGRHAGRLPRRRACEGRHHLRHERVMLEGHERTCAPARRGRTLALLPQVTRDCPRCGCSPWWWRSGARPGTPSSTSSSTPAPKFGVTLRFGLAGLPGAGRRRLAWRIAAPAAARPRPAGAAGGVHVFAVLPVCLPRRKHVPSGLVAVGYSASPLLAGLGAWALWRTPLTARFLIGGVLRRGWAWR
jgi:uncharacterized protein YcbX